jgi:hypothetical protein
MLAVPVVLITPTGDAGGAGGIYYPTDGAGGAGGACGAWWC